MVAAALTPLPASAVSCVFNNSPYALSFLNYDPVSQTAVTATITVSFTCKTIPAAGVAVTIAANAGSNGTVSNREMKDTVSADLLPYKASMSASYSPIFGDGTSSTVVYSTTVPKSMDNTAITFTVYGEIPAAVYGGAGDVQYSTTASYKDSVTLTMTY